MKERDSGFTQEKKNVTHRAGRNMKGRKRQQVYTREKDWNTQNRPKEEKERNTHGARQATTKLRKKDRTSRRTIYEDFGE